MYAAGFETTIPACERPQTHALDRTASETGVILSYFLIYIHTYIHIYFLTYLLACLLTYLLACLFTYLLT
jgi:hypothetical protein